jgi:hypothetical protein
MVARSSLLWNVMQCNILEERTSHLHRGGSLKSRKWVDFFLIIAASAFEVTSVQG